MNTFKNKTNPLWFALVLLVPTVLSAQETTPWQAPPEARKLKNRVSTTGEGLTATASLYESNCARCHGLVGAANGPDAQSLAKEPAILNDALELKGVTDGELFWKVTHGRAPMPAYAQLSEKQRWELVNYVRDLVRRTQYRFLGSRHTR